MDSFVFFLHHYNTRLCAAAVIQAYLERNNIEVLPHLPYSPDLALCNYWLFPMPKKAIRGWHFDSYNEVINAAHTFFSSISQKDDQRQVGREDGEVCDARRPVLLESTLHW